MKDGWSTFRGLTDWLKRLFDSGESFKVGSKVFHPVYGEGIIENIQGSGAGTKVCVDFGFAKPIVSLSDLTLNGEQSGTAELIHDASPEPAPLKNSLRDSASMKMAAGQERKVQSSPIESEPMKKPLSTQQMSEIEVEARKGITALRLGQVLESQINELSVGTAEIEQKFKDSISNTIVDGPTFLLVDAAWGVGKTHALTLLQVLARKTMFATSYVVMDGISTSLAHPMELMTEIMSGLRFPDNNRSTDFSRQLARAKQDERIDILEERGAEYLSDTLRSLPVEAFDDPDVLDMLCDFLALRLSATDANKQLLEMNYRAKLKGLKARAVSDRAPRFVQLLREWSVFCSAMGYNGLLLVLDELDVEYSVSAYGNQSDWKIIRRREELLRELKGLIKTPLMIAFSAAPGDPSLDQAFDPVRNIINCLGGKVQHIEVSRPNEKNLRLFLDRLLELYGDAYSIETAHLKQHISDRLFQELFRQYIRDPNAVTRRFVRSSIERMDTMLG